MEADETLVVEVWDAKKKPGRPFPTKPHLALSLTKLSAAESAMKFRERIDETLVTLYRWWLKDRKGFCFRLLANPHFAAPPDETPG
ncbi:MAG: hypothetical protein IT207_08730 [Fimbriimonadaceae bacterium]|nr:hypothetical protein [Fimbriimonadaceae bacterium]